MDAQPPVEARGLTRTFTAPDGSSIVAVDDVDLVAHAGAVTAILGPSGSGKSTLLQLLAGLDRPDRGTVRIGDTELTGLRDAALSRLRRREIGFVFQAFNLVPSLSARDNIALPRELDGAEVDDDRLHELAERLGIADRLDHRPGQLSGGQQQRVAVARALLPRPAVVLADEPTGALDGGTAEGLLELLTTTAREEGQTVVVVTHDERLAALADDVHRMDAGRLTAAVAAAP